MYKFREGELVKGSTLRVVKYLSDKMVECNCDICGTTEKEGLVSMIYKEAELHKHPACRFCSEREKAIANGLLKDSDIYMELLSKSSAIDILTARVGQRCIVTNSDELTNKNFACKFPLGSIYGELKSIGYLTTISKRNEYGVYFTTPTHIALKCKKCEYITFVKDTEINRVVHSCPLCSNLRIKRKSQLDNKKIVDCQRDIEKSQGRDFLQVSTEFSKLSRNKAMQKSVKTLEDKNKSYKVIDITKDGGATTYHLVCKDCGSIVTCMRSNAKISSCSFCEEKNKNKDYSKVGYLFKNYIGSIFNGLRVVKQDGIMCDVECIKCNKIRSNLDLYSVLSRRFFCDCAKSGVSLECFNCYAPLPLISFKDLYNNNLPKCPSCSTRVSEEDVLIAVEGMDYTNSLRAKLDLANSGVSDKATKKIRLGNKFAVDTLLVEKEPVYKGNNEKSYYRCFCKKHNIGLTLSEDEIMNYQCDYCDDSRQCIIANPDASSIKLD